MSDDPDTRLPSEREQKAKEQKAFEASIWAFGWPTIKDANGDYLDRLTGDVFSLFRLAWSMGRLEYSSEASEAGKVCLPLSHTVNPDHEVFTEGDAARENAEIFARGIGPINGIHQKPDPGA